MRKTESDGALQAYLGAQFEPISSGARAVCDAILFLHEKRILTEILGSLSSDVLPRHQSHEAVLDSSAGSSSPEPYSQRSQTLRKAQLHFDEALCLWARRFRLTDDMTHYGAIFPWALQFGRACCFGRPHLPGGPRPLSTSPMPIVASPRADETFPEWAKRIRPELREWYKGVRANERAVSEPPRQRNPDRYQWFVLHVCGGLTSKKIAERVSLEDMRKAAHRDDISQDGIRKGIDIVRAELVSAGKFSGKTPPN